MRQRYSRVNRFRKLLQRLQGRTGYQIEADLIYHLQVKKPQSVEELFLVLKRWTGNTRPKPYESIPSLWYFCSGERPVSLEYWEEQMLFFMFRVYDIQTHKDGYTKMPPYSFLLRCFIEESVMRIDNERLQRITRFLPIMQCKWRKKYYIQQYAHVRRVFVTQCLNVEGNSSSPGIPCQQSRTRCAETQEQDSDKRVQVTESILQQKGRRRKRDNVQQKHREALLQKTGTTGARNIWETEAIKNLLGSARE